jgi:hypothetical protein
VAVRCEPAKEDAACRKMQNQSSRITSSQFIARQHWEGVESGNLYLLNSKHHLALLASYLYINIMRTTVMIEDDVYVTAKQIAENSGRTLGAVISQLARKGLASEPSFDIKNGVPVFRIGNSSQKIPGSRAGEILDEEN